MKSVLLIKWYIAKHVATAETDTVKKYIVLPRISGTKNLVNTRTADVKTPDAPKNITLLDLVFKKIIYKITFSYHYGLCISCR